MKIPTAHGKILTVVRLSLVLFLTLFFTPTVLASMGVSEIDVVDILLIIGMPTALVFLATYPIIRSINKIKKVPSQEQLVSFIQSAALEDISHSEWQKFMKKPYQGMYMENARKNCLHILSAHNETPVVSEVKQKELHQIAMILRDNSQ